MPAIVKKILTGIAIVAVAFGVLMCSSSFRSELNDIVQAIQGKGEPSDSSPHVKVNQARRREIMEELKKSVGSSASAQ